MVQLHGDESPAFCRKFAPRVVKAFRLKDASSLAPMASYSEDVKAFLLDAYQEGMAGGTGTTFDWALARRTGDFGVPVILSGGLGPSNIRQAVTSAMPYAVDVNSGIEMRPGKKDPALMGALMEQINRLQGRMVVQ
jgi:phosphoribosylanthranilate isomerase